MCSVQLIEKEKKRKERKEKKKTNTCLYKEF